MMKLVLTKWQITTIVLVIAIAVAGSAVYMYWPRPGPREVTLVYTYQPSTHQIAGFIILHKHWIEEEAEKLGYMIRIIEQHFGSGPPQMERFASGAIDVAYVGATPVVSEVGWALEKGYPKAVIVAAANQQGSALVMRLDFEYVGHQGLKGTTLGTFPPGSIQDTILKDWLGRNGLSFGPPGTPGVDVVIRGTDPRELVVMLEAGKVDGIFVPSPSPEICEYKGTGRIAVSSAEMIPGHPCCVLSLRDSFIERYPDLAKIIVKLHIRAERVTVERPDEAIDIGAKKLAELWGQPEEFTRTVVERAIKDNPTNLDFNPDPHAIVEGVMKYVDIHWELGYIPVKPTEKDMFDYSLFDEVIKEL